MKTQPKIRQAPPPRNTGSVVTTRNQARPSSPAIRPTNDFGKTLQNLLGNLSLKDGVNEEEFFAGAVYHLIKDNFGSEIARDFKSTFKLNMEDKPKTERVASAERATKESLQFFVNSTILSKEDAAGIRQSAFEAAQLDNNKRYLWDSFGKTKAVSSFTKVEKLGASRLAESGYTPVTTQGTARSTRTNPIDAKNIRERRTISDMKRVG